MENQRHKIFISYYHNDDEFYKKKLENILGNEYAISRSVQLGDINPNNNADYIYQLIRDNYLSNSVVTIVLIGKNTWKRKFVDWEIYSSMRNTKNSKRSGVIGIILPTRDDYGENKSVNIYTIPPRLADNLGNDFVKIYDRSDDPNFYQQIIHKAFERKDKINPVLTRPLFARNRGENDDRWY